MVPHDVRVVLGISGLRLCEPLGLGVIRMLSPDLVWLESMEPS